MPGILQRIVPVGAQRNIEPARNAGATVALDALHGAQHPLSLYDSLLPSHSQPMELH